jgi:tRNA G18 (ribose-2'-O)-methylase SpoU
MGGTRLLFSRDLILEPTRTRPATDLTPNRRRRASRPSTKSRGEYAVLLDNIRSAWNVGSILRSADGFAFTHAYLCGITPTPDHEAVAKTSLGAEDSVSWSYHKDAVKLISGLKKDGWHIWALEEDKLAKSIQMISTPNMDQPVVLVLGSEVTGVDPGLLELSDEIFYIPMRGEKKSFNVAMAFSIAAYQIRK